MIYDRLCELCRKNNTNPTVLSETVSGSRGNLRTWKKGNIKSGYLIAIADRFNVSTDYLLCRTDNPTIPDSPHTYLTDGERDILEKLRKLAPEKINALTTLLE